MPIFKSFKQYCEPLDIEVKVKLEELRGIILTTLPSVSEIINYNIPSFVLVPGGTREEQIMIAGYTHHIGFYPHPTTIRHFDKQLTLFKHSRGAVQFDINKPLPKDLIAEMLRYRYNLLNENLD